MVYLKSWQKLFDDCRWVEAPKTVFGESSASEKKEKMRVFLVNELGPEFINLIFLIVLKGRNPWIVLYSHSRLKIWISVVLWNPFETIVVSGRLRWRNIGYWNGFCYTRTDSSPKQWLENCCWTDQFCRWSNTKIWDNQTGTLGRVVKCTCDIYIFTKIKVEPYFHIEHGPTVFLSGDQNIWS